MTPGKNSIILACPKELSLTDTLISGQCFRWSADGNRLCGVAMGAGVSISRLSDETLCIIGDGRENAEEMWRYYLDLDTDYQAIRNEIISIEPRLAEAAKRRTGIHILNQPPWEALCSFILSQNNNIARIRGLVKRLCELCGKPIEGGFDFPQAEKVAQLSEDSLHSIGCGYRAPYVLAAARSVCDGSLDLEELRSMPVEMARERLLELYGVGEKVADCVLLYGLHRLECFPRDVWIKRALAGPFKDTPLLGTPFAGIAQQYIFEYMKDKDSQG